MVTAMTPAAKISSETWRRLARAHLVGARLGEETLTDLLVLEMLHYQKSNAFQVIHPTRLQESRWGADLLVWIRRRKGVSQFLAIQAKKLYPDGHYKALNHHVSPGVRQIDLLDAFAHQYRAMPLYLLYNYFDSGSPNNYWHCCRTLDIEQLGCTLVPSWRIDRAIRRRGQRTFTAVHANSNSRPWRCAFDCDHPERQLNALTRDTEQIPFLQVTDPSTTRADASDMYPEYLQLDLPDFLLQMAGPLTTADLDELRSEIDERSENAAQGMSIAKHEPFYPRRVLIVDNFDTAEEEEV